MTVKEHVTALDELKDLLAQFSERLASFIWSSELDGIGPPEWGGPLSGPRKQKEYALYQHVAALIEEHERKVLVAQEGNLKLSQRDLKIAALRVELSKQFLHEHDSGPNSQEAQAQRELIFREWADSHGFAILDTDLERIRTFKLKKYKKREKLAPDASAGRLIDQLSFHVGETKQVKAKKHLHRRGGDSVGIIVGENAMRGNVPLPAGFHLALFLQYVSGLDAEEANRVANICVRESPVLRDRQRREERWLANQAGFCRDEGDDSSDG